LVYQARRFSRKREGIQIKLDFAKLNPNLDPVDKPLPYKITMCRSGRYLHYFLIAIVGILIFLPNSFSFFNSDDFVWLKNSQKLSFDSISHFSVNYEPVLKFRPLVHFFFQLLYTFFGLNPLGYHLTGLIFHLLNALIFYTLLLKFTSDHLVSFLSSLIFVSHFAQEETLFWISALSSPMVTFFYLCSVWSLWKYLTNKRTGFYFLSFLLCGLALLSKEDGVTIFLGLFLLVFFKSAGDFTFRFKKALKLSSPFLGLTILYSGIRYFTVPDYIMSKFLTYNPVVMIKNSCYFGISFLFPVRLFFDLVGFEVHSYLNNIIQFRLNNFWVILVLLLISLVFLLMVRYFLRKKIFGFKLGLGLILLGILPYLLVNGNGQRFLYFPSLGFSLALASLLLYFLDRIKKLNIINLLLVLMLVFNGAILYKRSMWWRKAGKVCSEVINKAGKIILSAPENSEFYFANLPQRMNGAYTFHTGFEEALSLFYPQTKTKVYDLGQLKDEELEALRDSSKGNIYIYKGRKFERALQ